MNQYRYLHRRGSILKLAINGTRIKENGTSEGNGCRGTAKKTCILCAKKALAGREFRLSGVLRANLCGE